MDAFVLPTFMQRCLGEDLSEASREAWDQKCKDYYEAMGSPQHLTWRDILIPFGISFDNAPIHRAYRKEALRPRVTLMQEFTALFEHATACDELHFHFENDMKDAFRLARDGFRKKAQAAEGTRATNAELAKMEVVTQLEEMPYSPMDFFVKAQFQQFQKKKKKDDEEGFTAVQLEAATAVAKAFMDIFKAAKKKYLEEHGVDWETLFRRQQALIDPRWLVFLPEQFMPLGNTTPDLHQVAEMLVGLYKGVMRRWATRKGTTAEELKCAQKYNEEMHKVCDERNAREGQGESAEMRTIRRSIARMWRTCQVVATDFGVSFQPSLFDPADHGTELAATEVGTGGRFPRKQIS